MYPDRKRMRLDGWDYSTEGAYFLTLCAKDRKCIFSHIVGRVKDVAPYGYGASRMSRPTIMYYILEVIPNGS